MRRKMICTWTDSPAAWKRNQEYQREQRRKREEKAREDERFQAELERIKQKTR